MTSPRPVSHILDGFALSDGYADAKQRRTADDDS